MKAKQVFLQKQKVLSPLKTVLIVSSLGLSAAAYLWSQNVAYDPLPIPTDPGFITPLTSHIETKHIAIADTFTQPSQSTLAPETSEQITPVVPPESSPSTPTETKLPVAKTPSRPLDTTRSATDRLTGVVTDTVDGVTGLLPRILF